MSKGENMAEHCPDCVNDHLPNKCDSCAELRDELNAAMADAGYMEAAKLRADAAEDALEAEELKRMDWNVVIEDLQKENAELRDILKYGAQFLDSALVHGPLPPESGWQTGALKMVDEMKRAALSQKECRKK